MARHLTKIQNLGEKMPKRTPDRYEAAIRLERACQLIRESERYGFPVSQRQAAEAEQASAEYDLATAALTD